MILINVLLITMVLYKIKILKLNEFNFNFGSRQMSNSIKGMAAIIVVIHHISQRIPNSGMLVEFRTVGYLATSIFFFYSGYGLIISYKNKENYLNDFLSKRLTKILIPFIVANIIYLTWNYFYKGVRYTLEENIMYLIGIRLINGHTWYVVVLVVFYIAFYFCFKYLKDNDKFTGIILFCMLYWINCNTTGFGEWWYNSSLCFFIGILVGNNYEEIYLFLKKNYLILTIIIFMLTKFTFDYYTKNGGIIISSISTILFIFSCICIFMKVNISNNIMNYFGNISYELYLIHRIVLDTLMPINHKPYLYIILSVIGSIIVAYIFKLLLKRIDIIVENIRIKKI